MGFAFHYRLPTAYCRLPTSLWYDSGVNTFAASPAATAAAHALLDRAVRDRANIYGGSGALGVGWEAYLLPRVVNLVGRDLPDGARLVAQVPFGAIDAIALECSTRGLRQPDFLFLIEREGVVGIAGADAKLGLDTVDAKQIAAETTGRILTEGGPRAQAAITALIAFAPARTDDTGGTDDIGSMGSTPAADGYILTPQRVLNDLVLSGTRPRGMPPPHLPARTQIVTVALSGTALLGAVATGPFARALVEGTDEAHEADTFIDAAVLLTLAAHLLLGVWREQETPLTVSRIPADAPQDAEFAPALQWGRERVRIAGSAWEAATMAADRAKPRLIARARVQEALQPPMTDPSFLPPAYLRGRTGRIARTVAATTYRDALLAALPPDLPDRSDALIAAITAISQRDAEQLRAAVSAALYDLNLPSE